MYTFYTIDREREPVSIIHHTKTGSYAEIDKLQHTNQLGLYCSLVTCTVLHS